jgi:hypothetical protein
MRPPPTVNRRFSLEALETRTLLAADVPDPYGLIADFNLAMHAVSATGDLQASFSTNFGNHQLVLTGNSDSSLTIDLSQLPAFISNLKISSFGDVHLLGTDHVDNLILTSIGSVAASNLSVTQATFTSDVAALDVASLGINAVLDGSDMSLTAHSLDGTTIFSNLHSLTLTSESKTLQFIALPRAGASNDQTLNLTYVPAITAISGISESSIHIVLPPVDAGHSTPVTPTDNSNPGSATSDPTPTTNPTPAPDSSQLVIVSLPLDERTRALLGQLRDLLQSTNGDSQQQVLDLLNNYAGLVESHAVNPILAGGIVGPGALDLAALTAVIHGNLDAGNLGAKQLSPEGSALIPLATHRLGGDLGLVTSQSVDQAPGLFPDQLSVGGVVSVDVTWLPALDAVAPLPPLSSGAHGSSEQILLAPTLSDSVRALGTYIVERVSAEFSPGQQSLVLMVDPQPSRRAEPNRKAAVESLIAGLDTPMLSEVTEAA